MSWKRFLEENPDINIEDLGKPVEFKPPVKDKRTTPKGPGSLNIFLKKRKREGEAFRHKSDASIQQMRESWMGIKPAHQQIKADEQAILEPIIEQLKSGYTKTTDLLKNLIPPPSDRPSTTQQLQRQAMTKSRQLGEARKSWQKQTQNQKIDSLSTEPNPGNTSPWKQDNPIVPGSNADAGKWTGSDEMWKDSQKRLEQGEEAWITPKKKPPEKDTKPTDTKPKETELEKRARISKGLSTLASALGDQSVKTHTVRVGEIDENPFSGYIG